ncbi:alanine--tRNA ligase [Candidatus Woesearchaeota archaeon]|nr:alanine--tRNA ligase [Candidatus Woesearchaeota archaeon]
MSDDDVKKEFKKKAQANPEKFYPVKTLQELGFKRKLCSCGQYFWTTKDKNHCGEPACSGGLSFIGKSPAKKKLGYIQVWKEFAAVHKKLGYTEVKRYPVVARWNPTTDFTIASIAAFQPFVVSGEVEPPANPLVIPQFCLRFGDIDNVGVTGHFCGFIMMGQHAFVAPQNYDINKYLKDHLTWLNKGMGLSNDDITVHEDAWAGGGNYGPCVEFFSAGLEISNQVYMQYEVPNKELKIKVLDMGQGMERAGWFTQGATTSYETTFPEVLKKLRKTTGMEYDEAFMKKFVPLSSYLKVEEGVDLEKEYLGVAKKLGMQVTELKEKVQKIAALYSVAEHSRTLLVALRDGALPSNVGGMYNLRVILRRALSFIEKYKWNVDICDVFEWHAQELKELFPELSENLDTTKKILEVEKIKYAQNKEKTAKLIEKFGGKQLSTEQLIELYDSHGVDPRDLNIRVPENFYALITKKHENTPQETQTEREEKIELPDLPATKALYFDDWKKIECKSKVLAVKDNFVVLDQTVFYPISGGQMQDTGMIGNLKVLDVFKQGNLIIHKVDGELKKGQEVTCKVDLERRKQITQHHTATHIVNAATRRVLGQHINQASAKKDVDKAHLDVTHYQAITEEELKLIETEANKIVKQKVQVIKEFMPRNKAEKTHGVRIYQGGVAPGKELRIVDIKGIEAEACGGTHLNNTEEAEIIKLVKTTKVKDGVVRIFFLAGNAAKKLTEEKTVLENSLAKELGVKVQEVPSRLEDLFELWKNARKANKKGQKLESYELKKKETYSGDIISKSSELLSTQPEHLIKTIQKFKKEIEEFRK